jgi:hypothetical protein
MRLRESCLDLHTKMCTCLMPQERANTEAFVSGKPMKMTISKESLAAWNAMSKAEQV